ncbi:MAG: penicillin-binding protein 2 [Gammaproteobacteria bacterium]|nr:penicillin-binding protein 2 [Gammaproteobacteria bacterium]
MKRTGWRRSAVTLITLLGFCGLVWRAADLQLNHKEFLQSEGDARVLRVVDVPAHRGKILDRNGYPLAISTPVESVWVNPGEFSPEPAEFNALVKLLGLDGEVVARSLASRRDREFYFLKRHVDPDVANSVVALAIPGVHLQREYRRYYPLGEVTAHVVGFTNVDDVGQEGLELAYDKVLRGVTGSKRVLRDRFGRIVADVERIRAPSPGKDIVLSIDRRIQYHAYRELLKAAKSNRARSASAVVLDARTGEVLAMVNQPSYNPNNRSERVGSKFRNRAVTDVFEPGSTIKPFTIAAALSSGRFDSGTVIDTSPGFVKVGKYTVKDIRNFGRIDLGTIVKKSSNVGATKIALSLPPKELWQVFSRLGFGKVTGSGFPGEAEGVFSHYFEWGDAHRATLSYGYGVSVTALQLALAYAGIANDGRLPEVNFLAGARDVKGTRVISADVAFQVRRMVEAVVSVGGTGARAAVGGYRVAGKTGTARKVTPSGYSEDKYVALFAGMAPMSAPRIVVVVVIDEPNGEEYYGGRVAAPVFAEITRGALRLLGLAPDNRGADAPAVVSARLADRAKPISRSDLARVVLSGGVGSAEAVQ